MGALTSFSLLKVEEQVIDRVVDQRDKSQETESQPKNSQTECNQIHFTFIMNKHNLRSISLSNCLPLGQKGPEQELKGEQSTQEEDSPRTEVSLG